MGQGGCGFSFMLDYTVVGCIGFYIIEAIVGIKVRALEHLPIYVAIP